MVFITVAPEDSIITLARPVARAPQFKLASDSICAYLPTMEGQIFFKVDKKYFLV
jgi:hypothetical protein